MLHAGSNSDPTVTTLRYNPLRHATLTCHKPRIVHTLYTLNFITRGRSRRGTLYKMASFIVDSCRDQRFSLETWDGSKNDRLGSMHTSDHRRSVSYKNWRLHTFLRGARSFTEEERRRIMMTKIRESRMSDFSCEKTKVCMDS